MLFLTNKVKVAKAMTNWIHHPSPSCEEHLYSLYIYRLAILIKKRKKDLRWKKVLDLRSDCCAQHHFRDMKWVSRETHVMKFTI
jgi:hypothetical protein